MNRIRKVLDGGVVLLVLGLAACGETTTDEQKVNLDKANPRAILAPGKAGTLSGSTLEVPVIPGTVHVYSVPEYAGVEAEGDIGIASSIGYDPGERIVLPINVNLGTQNLDSYAITLTVNNPDAIQIVDVEGSYGYLATSYPTEYESAEGFEGLPTVNIGDTITTISATSDLSIPATGRINLANVTVDILDPGPLPPTGATITFTLDSLQNENGDDLCRKIGVCTPFDAILIENFKIIY